MKSPRDGTVRTAPVSASVTNEMTVGNDILEN